LSSTRRSLNSTTGAITGTPTAAGNQSLTVTVTDASSPTPLTATGALSIQIAPALAVTTKSLPGDQVGNAYPGSTLASTGGIAPVTWAVTAGSLAAGLTLSATSGALTGTPTGPGVVSTFTVAATDSASPPAVAAATLSIAINSEPLAIITNSLPAGEVGASYPGISLSAAGGTAPVAWAVTAGSLPKGLILNAATGVITGTPTAVDNTAFTVTATDSSSPTPLTARTSLLIVVTPSLAITSATLPGGQVGSVYVGGPWPPVGARTR
jgi:hypothetical protein